MGKRQLGFTLVELIIVIVVIGILTAAITVSYIGGQKNTYDTTVQNDLRNIAAAMKTYRANTGAYPSNATAISSMNNTEGVNPRVTRTAYNLETITSGNARNLLVCKRDGSTPDFGLVALSKSGAIWLLKNDGEVAQGSGTWTGDHVGLCGQTGVTSASAGYAYWFGYERAQAAPIDGGWKTWAAK